MPRVPWTDPWVRSLFVYEGHQTFNTINSHLLNVEDTYTATHLIETHMDLKMPLLPE